MKKPKHTPGVWEAWQPGGRLEVGTAYKTVAVIRESSREPDAEDLANAALIAAAPRMADAIRAMLVSVEMDRREHPREGYDGNRANIIRAGEAALRLLEVQP